MAIVLENVLLDKLEGDLHIRLVFQPEDFWIGVSIEGWAEEKGMDVYTVYVNILPMLPIQFRWEVEHE